MITFKKFLRESAVFNPSVAWVDKALTPKRLQELSELPPGDIADELTQLFAKKKVGFEVTSRPNYGGLKKARETGVVEAEYVHDGDPEIIVYLSRTVKKGALHPEFKDALKELIKHELIHKEQYRRAGGRISSEDLLDDLKYYGDPFEVAAIASEVEAQLLKVEPNPEKLIKLVQARDPRLIKGSERWKTYVDLYAENPTKFRRGFQAMVKALVARLQAIN